MGIFSFKGKETVKPMLGMILLEEANSIQMDKVVRELKESWKLTLREMESAKETSILVIDGYRIAIANMPVPIPGDEIKAAAEYNYFWQNGVEEASKHKEHVILSIMNAGKDNVKENILFNQVAAAILNHSKALGVYIGGRTLLLKKDFYLANTEMMSEQDLPLYNWIYFGLRQEKGKQSIYTYGLADFNKPEMEIVNSNKSMAELSEIMFNMAHYVVASDVILKDGETIGMSATQKLEISYSKGKYLDGKTLKIKY
ncbi:DUF4261 domain-containing protein [Marinifilum sp. JC070]|uniref:DUF4261 domain-containing protein n=2 Tax=Marinifilum caeruleilacunae TaxID=2499076 RepID=A0ABX1X1P1_9BACT|nr:DUF4261 domain-containing protein [Marinifilum caeruleilacunae]